MPASTFLSYELVNVGPLTTTFTAPAACETSGDRAIADRNWPFEEMGYESCSNYRPIGSCAASGDAIDAISSTRGRVIYDFGWAIPYHSPGLHCPSGFTTAGVAEMSANGESSVTGIFSMTAFVGYSGQGYSIMPTPYSLPAANVVASALNEGETAVICCKDGFTADPQWGCHSNYPATQYTATAYCRRWFPAEYVEREIINTTFTYNGQILDGKEWSSTESPTSWAIETQMMDLDEYTDGNPNVLTGYTTVPMVTLIHRGSNNGPEETAGSPTPTSRETESAESSGDAGSGAATIPKVGWSFLALAGMSALTSSLCW